MIQLNGLLQNTYLIMGIGCISLNLKKSLDKLPNMVISAYLCSNKQHSPHESDIQG